MNKKTAIGGLILLAFMVGIVIGTTKTPKIDTTNGTQESSTATLKLNQRYEAKTLSQHHFVYSGWYHAGDGLYKVTIVFKHITGYAGGVATYDVVIQKNSTFLFGGQTFQVKEVNADRVVLEVS